MCSATGSLSTVALAFTKVEDIRSVDEPTFNEKHALEVELKPFRSSLRYEFFGPNSIYSVNVNANLSALQILLT